MTRRILAGAVLGAAVLVYNMVGVSCGGDESVDGGPAQSECAGKSGGEPCGIGYCVMFGDTPECRPECTIPGETCELDESAGACYNTGAAGKNACLEPGAKAKGDTCTAFNDCAAGMACLSPDEAAALRCHEVCDGTCGEGTCEDTGLGFSVCVE
ncbi:MAG: hypothetical protein HY897_14470 [Deltaproteobacteria bacterium]|nr:hypothetical protein [Deltaproteobacteria bacterium]